MEFREKVKAVGEKGLKILEEYLDGKREETRMIKEASRMISNAIKVEHMDQIRDYQKKSLSLRLLNFLPNDEVVRTKYIEITNPEVRPLLLARPKK